MTVRKRYLHESVEGVKVGRLNAGINTNFIVYRVGDTLIDTGPSNQWRSVKPFVQAAPVNQLLLTHHHEDHSGNGARIAKLCGITPKAPALAYEKLAKGYPTPLVQKIVWGSPIPVETQPLQAREYFSDGTEIIPVHTPGHAKDLTCFYVPEKRWLFSGDLYIAKSLKYLRADENLTDLIASLEKVLKLDFDVVFCPHAGIITDGKTAMATKRDNLVGMCAQAQSMKQSGKSISDITHALLGEEDMLSKISRYNISKGNLIKEALAVPL